MKNLKIKIKNILNSAAKFLLSLIIKLIKILPHKLAVKLGGWLGRLVWLVSWRKVDTCESRCVKALGVGVTIARKIILKSFINLGMSIAEFVRLELIKDNLNNLIIEVENLEVVNEALARGKGVIFMLAHMGNWELCGEFMTLKGYKLAAIYKPQNNSLGAEDFIKSQREDAAGLELIEAHSLNLREIFRALKANKILCVLQDLDARKRGVDINFMGMPASCYDGIIKIYNKLGSPIIPALCLRDTKDFTKHKIIFGEIISDSNNFGQDVSAALDACNNIIAGWIRQWPEQWMWNLDRWESKLRVRKSKQK
ncbi:MAG: lysophospholipid acyltransferase family protein [Synergistaceae bacterium]|nr:lysophospholipid acyltransferase family protein [Synergistaceae bacterium]